MRESNAIKTNRNRARSRRIAKRAILLALLFGSCPAASAQYPSAARDYPAAHPSSANPTQHAPGQVVRNRFFDEASAAPQANSSRSASPQLVRQGARVVQPGNAPATNPAENRLPTNAATAQNGSVRLNPFFQTVDTNQRSIDQSENLFVRKSARPVAPPTPLPPPTSAAPIAASGSAFLQTSTLPQRSTATQPVAAARIARQNVSSRVIPVADTQDPQAEVSAAQPIYFSLSDDELAPGDVPIGTPSESTPNRKETQSKSAEKETVEKAPVEAAANQPTPVAKKPVAPTADTNAGELQESPQAPAKTKPQAPAKRPEADNANASDASADTSQASAATQPEPTESSSSRGPILDYTVVKAAAVDPAKAEWKSTPKPSQDAETETAFDALEQELVKKKADPQADSVVPSQSDDSVPELVQRSTNKPQLAAKRVADPTRPAGSYPVWNEQRTPQQADSAPVLQSLSDRNASQPPESKSGGKNLESLPADVNVSSELPIAVHSNPLVKESLVETSDPVQLAPIVSLAEPVGPRTLEVPDAPIVEKLSAEPAVNRAEPLDDPLVHRTAPDEAIDAAPTASKVVAPSVQKVELPETKEPPAVAAIGKANNSLTRKAVDVTTPPIQIERTDVDGVPMKPAVGAVAVDPAVLMGRPGQVPSVPRTSVESLSPISATQAATPPGVADDGQSANELVEANIIAPPSRSTSLNSVLASESTNATKSTGRTMSFEPETPTDQNAVLLQLKMAQVRSMTIGGRLRRASVNNNEICQAFASSENQIKLIGTGIGRTELTIWADVAPGEPTRKQTFVIDVSQDVDATGDKITEHTVLLNDSIDKAFPRASVVVSREGGQLVVTGHCDDELTAKQIIRMVRKSCLIPVQDNLKVR